MARYENNIQRADPKFTTIRTCCRMVEAFPSEENLSILEGAIRTYRQQQGRETASATMQPLDATAEVVKDGLFE